MQIKLFTIPVTDTGLFMEEMNRFLRGYKILEIQQQLVSNEHGASWCFCVKYIESNASMPVSSEQKVKVDYRTLLDEATFNIFSRLREIRKAIAIEEGFPAYTVFTDEELANIAKLTEITPSTMQSIKGIGQKKVEKYAARFIQDLQVKVV
jgi:superfamily II DNA helicase RecQ